MRLGADAGRQYENSEVSPVTMLVAVAAMPPGSPMPPGSVWSNEARPLASAVTRNVPRYWRPSPKNVLWHAELANTSMS